MRGVRLVDEEGHEDHDGEGAQRERIGREPGMHVGLDHANVKRKRPPGTSTLPTGSSERAPDPRLPHGRQREREAGDANRHVDPEHGRPAELPDEQAATIGPHAEADPATLAQIPMAVVRSSGG